MEDREDIKRGQFVAHFHPAIAADGPDCLGVWKIYDRRDTAIISSIWVSEGEDDEKRADVIDELRGLLLADEDEWWTQIGGDHTASEYGALFGKLDKGSNKVYGVRVVEVQYMPEACGDDWTNPAGNYLASESYCEVDSWDWHHMSMLDSCGYELEGDEIPDYPPEIDVRVREMNARFRDLRKLAEWEGKRWEFVRDTTPAIGAQTRELQYMRWWYSLPRMVRAEMMHSYGGYRSGQELVFATLAEAMDYFGILPSALWNEREYNAPDPDGPDAEDE